MGRWCRVGPLTLLLCALAAAPLASAGEAKEPLTGILGAMAEEVRLLVGQLKEGKRHEVEGITFWTGRLKGRRVVVAMTGVGKVNAALTAALLHHRFHPTEVLFTGIAGALNPTLRPADIVIAEKAFQHDLGRLEDGAMVLRGARNPVDFLRNPVFFPADENLLKVAKASAKRIALDPIATRDGKRTPKVVTGTVATGDVFVASPAKSKQLHAEFKADAVEMEGAAVAQVCWQWRVPCLVIRSISDTADDNAVLDARMFRRIAARNSALLVADIVAHLPSAAKPQ